MAASAAASYKWFFLLPINTFFSVKLLLQLYFFCYAGLFIFMYKDSITLREQPWNTCMICLGGEGKGGGLIIVTLCTTTLWIYCVCIHCCRIALRSLFRGGICSDFSFQNIKLCVLKAERINVNRMNYRITHGARVCRSFSFLHLSRTWHPQ